MIVRIAQIKLICGSETDRDQIPLKSDLGLNSHLTQNGIKFDLDVHLD